MNKKARILMIAGMLMLVLGSLSLRVLPNTDAMDGVKGMLYGMAIGLNLMSLRVRNRDEGC